VTQLCEPGQFRHQADHGPQLALASSELTVINICGFFAPLPFGRRPPIRAAIDRSKPTKHGSNLVFHQKRFRTTRWLNKN
jgi:hypothetical protein